MSSRRLCRSARSATSFWKKARKRFANWLPPKLRPLTEYLECPAHSCILLFHAERPHWINRGGAPRRNNARKSRDKEQHRRSREQRQRITRSRSRPRRQNAVQ